MELILASGNSHKAEEFKELFKGIIHISSAPRSIDVDETGATFQENAYLKAEAYYKEFKQPTLADDSGLVVTALPDMLGIHSARFSPELKTYAEKSLKLIELLKDKQDRSAYFICVLCFYLSPDEVYFFEGRVHGIVGSELKGEHGFGYDPVFIPERKEQDGKSLAELPEWKNEFSHRAKASFGAMQFFKESIDKSRNKP